VNRVVVTGLGAVSPIGHTSAAYWSGLIEGRNGIGPITIAHADELIQKVAAEVKDFQTARYFDDNKAGMLDRVSQFAVVAAREAIAQAGLSFDAELSERTATIIGVGVGGQNTHDDSFRRIYKHNLSRVYPMTIPRLMVNAPASQISMDCNLRGPAFVVASACASATHAIGLAAQMVRLSQVTCAITGGAEACITFGTLRGWEAMRIMAPDTCRPFSKGRKGMILGEGAAVLVLESLDYAQRRGAEILGEVVGFGMSADARDITSPDQAGMARAIRMALADAGLSPSQIQYVNAHGTGTTANDQTEAAALHECFGQHLTKLAVSSTKSMVGHSLGASGALEFVATLMALREGVAPPTMNFVERDPACDVDCVPNQARPMRIDAAISNSFAFGGLNAVLVAKRFA
jgi:nodulation protein E